VPIHAFPQRLPRFAYIPGVRAIMSATYEVYEACGVTSVCALYVMSCVVACDRSISVDEWAGEAAWFVAGR